MRNWLLDICVALALLTRLPLPNLPRAAFERMAQAAWAYPLAGILVSGLAALTGLAAHGLGVQVPVVALVVIAVELVLTGAMHEDGLADTADGLWGGWTREERLEIMKDSRTGTYGVLALIVAIGLRWSALTALIGAGPGVAAGALLAAASLSRGALPAIMHRLPNARADGLSHGVGRPGRGTALCAAGLALVLAVAAGGGAGIAACLVSWLGCAGVARVARARIGGQTGDILGAAQQVGMILALVTFATLRA